MRCLGPRQPCVNLKEKMLMLVILLLIFKVRSFY